jgi:superfamily II DNA/RNA helicase
VSSTTVSTAPTVASFGKLGLPDQLVTTLARRGIHQPFPIQAATLVDALAGKDVLGRAQTGSGKTLAFGLPMISRLAGGRSSSKRPRGLVLVPTRELAMQVHDALAPLGQPLGVSMTVVIGGAPMHKQMAVLRRSVDIVVATPGRLADLISQHACDLQDVEIAVLDEADHMSDMGFLPAVRELLDQVRPGGQRLLFSATLDHAVKTVVDTYLKNAVTHSTTPLHVEVANMEHHILMVAPADKLAVVSEIANRPGRSLLFVRTKHGADRLTKQLRRAGVNADALHGGKTQNARTRILAEFREGTITCLVATDVAARGIHVDDVDLVLHVDPAGDHKDYLHRAGRTARAGESGTVVSVITHDQERATSAMTRKAGVKAPVLRVTPGAHDLVRVTGARPPSGIAQAERPSSAPPARPSRVRPDGRAYGAPRTGGGAGGPRGRRGGHSAGPAARTGVRRPDASRG